MILVLWEEYKFWISFYLLHIYLIFIVLDTFLDIYFSDILNACFSPSASDESLHIYTATNNILMQGFHSNTYTRRQCSRPKYRDISATTGHQNAK
jgi:hypothetical protein